MSIEVDIRKSFQGFCLDVKFQTNDDSCMGILGSSGCGKSMTLKCIAGVVTPDEGKIVVNGRVLFDSHKKINLKPQQRKIGFLFQDYALFPTMTALQNISCSIKASNNEKKDILNSLVEKFQLKGLENLYPLELSGGQQQRVAIARIIANDPEVILLDEPFSALDSYLREQMQDEMIEILKRYKNALFVSHSRDEVHKLCKELMVMVNGRSVVSGRTMDVFARPQKIQAARLMGCKNISRIEIIGDYEIRAVDWGGKMLKTTDKVKEGIKYVGIYPNAFIPWDKFYDDENIMEVDILTETQGLEYVATTFKSVVAEGNFLSENIFWTHTQKESKVRFLKAPKDKLFLLEE